MARKASLAVIFLTVFIDLIGFGMVLPLLPIYGKEFARQLNLVEGDPKIGLLVGSLMASFSLMQFIFSPIWGRVSDRLGRRPVLLIGLAGSVVSYALFGVATIIRSLPLLFITRIGAGIAGATISTAQAYIADVTSLEKRSKGMALIGAAFGLGFTFGPLLAYLTLLESPGELGAGPGFAAAALSLVALLFAWFRLSESLPPNNQPSERHWFDWSSLREALATPSVAPLMITSFVCVFSFANFESTLSLLINESVVHAGGEALHGAARLERVCLLFAYVGFMLMLVQGGIVRRLSGKISEVKLASAGAALEIFGFAYLIYANRSESLAQILIALGVIVGGFAFITPSINGLISRRSDPKKQGGIMGVLQSVNSLARILGPVVGVSLYHRQSSLPLLLAAALMFVGLLLVLWSGRGGHDYGTAADVV